MKTKLLFVLCLLVCISIACSRPDIPFTTTENQLILPQKNGTLALTVFSSKIIRVTFSANDALKQKRNLQ